MTLTQEIENWNARWKKDFWWRKKYNIAFGSAAHREANQIDISFEYLESRMAEKAVKMYYDKQEKEKRYKDTKQWMEEEKATDQDWDKIDISKL